MPRNLKTAAASGKAALPQLSAQLLAELIHGPVTKEQFEDIFPESIERNNSASLHDRARHERISRASVVFFFRQNPLHAFALLKLNMERQLCVNPTAIWIAADAMPT